MNFNLDFILNVDFKYYIVAFMIFAIISISIILAVMKRREVEHEDDKREIEHVDDKREVEHVDDKREIEHEDDRREVEHVDDKREVVYDDKKEDDQFRNSSTYEHNSIKFSYIWAQQCLTCQYYVYLPPVPKQSILNA